MNDRTGPPSSNPPDPRLLLDLYLDGELTGDRLREFERCLLEDAGLRDLLWRQERIDAALRRSFAMPATAEATANAPIATPLHCGNGEAGDRAIGAGAAGEVRRPPPIRRPLAIAASIVLLIGMPVIAWNTWRSWNTQHRPAHVRLVRGPVRALDVAYRAKVAEGFVRDWECKDQTEFANSFAASLGQPVRMREAPATVKPLGLSYTGGITTETIGLLAKVEDQPVVVFADRTENDRMQQLTDPGLKLFKRELGPLVLYEVTPRESPALLEYFYLTR